MKKANDKKMILKNEFRSSGHGLDDPCVDDVLISQCCNFQSHPLSLFFFCGLNDRCNFRLGVDKLDERNKMPNALNRYYPKLGPAQRRLNVGELLKGAFTNSLKEAILRD